MDYSILKNLITGRKGFDIPMFKDAVIQRNLKRQGYHVCDYIISEKVIAELQAAFDKFVELYDKPLPETFYASGDAKSSPARTHVLTSMKKLFVPEVQKLIRPEHARAEPGIFQIKPSSEKSELNSHQDAALVDENKYFSVYAWASLTDNTRDNGALYVLPGSHRFGNVHRSNTTNWQFYGYEDIIKKYSKVLETKAGQIILFDCALIHGSLANNSGKIRVAASGCVMPKSAPLIMSYIDKDTPAETVDIYQVNEDYFMNDDIYARPSSKYPYLGNVKFKRLNLDRKSFEFYCKLNNWLS